jgi:hypothetical protein
MNDTLICKRCGWRCDEQEPRWMQDDEGQLVKLPVEMTTPHTRDECNSPYVVGQTLYWDMDLVDPDLPPIRVVFKEVVEFESAVFVLHQSEWVKERDARASVVSVLVDMKAVYPQHEKIYGREILEKPIDVKVESLHPVETWPMIEVA